MVLLPLWDGDLALDGESDAIGTWYAKGGGIATYLYQSELTLSYHKQFVKALLCVHGRSGKDGCVSIAFS